MLRFAVVLSCAVVFVASIPVHKLFRRNSDNIKNEQEVLRYTLAQFVVQNYGTNGKLTRYQLEECLNVISNPANANVIQELYFANHDTNGDNFLDTQELVSALEDVSITI